MIAKGLFEPSLHVARDGSILVTGVASPDVYFLSRKFGSWSRPVKVSGNIQGGVPSMAANDADTIFIAWASSGGVFVAATTDGGASWRQKAVTVESGDDASIAIDSDRRVSIAWSGRDGVKFSRSTDGGVNWAPPAVIDPSGCLPN